MRGDQARTGLDDRERAFPQVGSTAGPRRRSTDRRCRPGAATKRYELYRFGQLSTYLLLPVLLQWSLGGFSSSGAVMLWAVFAPLGALLFSGINKALGWFAAFVVLLVISGVFDGTFAAHGPTVSEPIRILFFCMNVGGVYATIYAVLRFFIAERDRFAAALAAENARSEGLLLNILPSAIADRLKDETETIADAFPEVTVLFADIVGFTPIAARTAPERLVRLLNDVFSAFDDLTDRHGLEKIKTIGDAYMVAGGLPSPRPDHAEAVAEMALDMREVVERFQSDEGEPLRIRIGINSGPLVAGVIGRKKFIYDLWGDTVNLASRMESQGEVGAIQVTDATYAKLRDRYDFEPRGTIENKGHGPMKTYLLIGRKRRPSDISEPAP
jgi:guanylate cyclase